jgi:hypothetical protein
VNRWIVGFGVLALFAVGAIWFFSAYERVPAREWVGPTGEARRNPYLAAERLAVRMGMPARELRLLPDLGALKPQSVLFLPNRRQALDPRRIREIAAWVQGGGHLIAEAEFIGVSDPLFDLLGVQRQSAPAPAKPLPLELADGRKLAVSIYGAMTLQVDAKPPARFVSFRHGKGTVSALASFHFARNGVIGSGDNADFFWHLLSLTPAAEVAVYLRPERLSLWGFLIEHAAPVLFATAALIALWLWRIAPRFGPVQPDPPPARRRLLDHLRASGRYYWSRGMRGRLVSTARDGALRRINRAQPDFAGAPAAERLARVCALAAIPREEALRFLNAAERIGGAEFIRVMHTAQRIHSALEKGTR